MGRPILFFISRPTSDVITSFRVEPIYYIETCSSRSSSIFSSTLIYGTVFPFPGGNRALARSNNYVHAMGPIPMSVSQSPRLDPTMISISCSNLIDLFRPLGAAVPKMKLSTAFFLVCCRKMLKRDGANSAGLTMGPMGLVPGKLTRSGHCKD